MGIVPHPPSMGFVPQPILRVTVPSVCAVQRETGDDLSHVHRQIQRRLVNRQVFLTRHTRPNKKRGGRGLRPQPCRPRRGTQAPALR